MCKNWGTITLDGDNIIFAPFELYSRPVELKPDMDTSGFCTDSIDSSEIIERHKKRFSDAWEKLSNK